MPSSSCARGRQSFRAVALAAAACAAATVAAAPAAQAAPLRGHVPLTVVLCKTADHPEDPLPVIAGGGTGTPAFYRSFFADQGTGARNFARYFEDQSYGQIDFSRAAVKGWYTMKQTAAEEHALGGGGSPTRGQKVQHCLDAAAVSPVDRYVPSAHDHVFTLANTGIDLFGSRRRAYGDNLSTFAHIAHEFGHSLGLDHTFSEMSGASVENGDWFDLMSCMNCATTDGVAFGTAPSMMVAPQRDRMGWIPRRRIVTFGANGTTRRTIRLGAINTLANPGAMMLRIPFDAGDPFRYYTVEVHARDDGWGARLASNVVLVHEVKNGRITLVAQRDLVAGAAPATLLSANGVAVRLSALAPAGATVTVTGGIATACLPGYVWREAGPTDLVCVTPATREATRTDNALAPGRTQANRSCISGYVWREAYAGDVTCVPPATRARAKADNASAASRVNVARFVRGPNACAPGYVWRAADDADYVCVTPATRDETRADNAASPSRTLANGLCRTGFVWREAYLGDNACVVPPRRDQASIDNLAAESRLLRPNG